MIDGQEIPFEAVVKRRTKTLLHIDNTLGFSGSTFSPGAYGDALIIEAQAELSKLADAIEFLHDAINYPHLTKKKVNTTAVNILNNIPSLKLSATDVLRSLSDGIYFNRNSNIHQTSILRQKQFLDGILEEIKTDADKVLGELYDIMKLLAKPQNAFVHLATDAQELASKFGQSLPLLQSLFNQSNLAEDRSYLMERYEIKSEHEYRRAKGERVDDHVAFGVGGTESCFLKQSVLYNNTDWTHKEVCGSKISNTKTQPFPGGRHPGNAPVPLRPNVRRGAWSRSHLWSKHVGKCHGGKAHHKPDQILQAHRGLQDGARDTPKIHHPR